MEKSNVHEKTSLRNGEKKCSQNSRNREKRIKKKKEKISTERTPRRGKSAWKKSKSKKEPRIKTTITTTI